MLHIQDLLFSQSYSTHEALIKSCSSAVSGCGAFAFASASGIKLLFNDQEFDALLERGSYSLVVGIDEITNLASLEALNAIRERRPYLDVKAFFHNEPTLFHPKLSFFKNSDGLGTLVVGSGNLTLGGLRQNREGFAMVSLDADETQKVESYWSSWLNETRDNLQEISDARVVERVKQNRLRGLARHFPIAEKDQEEDAAQSNVFSDREVDSEWSFSSTSSRVLLAEIPRSGDRWKQANFDINTFRDFFGATPGDNSQRILLRNVLDDSSLGPIEVRQSVSVQSQNYRFELDAATGLAYPSGGAPIGIFIKLSTRLFLYHIFMPSSAIYPELRRWMIEKWSGRTDRMKRIVVDATEVDGILSSTVFSSYKG
ncbi:MAG: hypothetical protein COB19_01515 [Porticoccus sp.]|nr:MAG: hypothetical protein COB19_01515 [Porticoccus sp.]